MRITEQKNRLIAEFMGFELQDNPNERWFGQFFTTPTKSWSGRIEILHFDTSWDWLMPVVSKIDKTYTDEVLLLCKVNLFNAIHKCNIKDTYDEVIEFIENYNKTKS